MKPNGWHLAVSSSCLRVVSRQNLDSVAQLDHVPQTVAVEAFAVSTEVGAGSGAAVMACSALDVWEHYPHESNFEIYGVSGDLTDDQLSSLRSTHPRSKTFDAGFDQALSHL